jgi:acylphosphatase
VRVGFVVVDVRQERLMQRVLLFVSGEVQGVFFRASTREVARRLGLSGFARNLGDGRVEIVAEGEEEAVQKLVEWVNVGPPNARVDRVEARDEQATGAFQGFSVTG